MIIWQRICNKELSYANLQPIRLICAVDSTFVASPPYNTDMAHLSPDRRMTRLLLAVLFGLLALGPFLHAHLGFSKVTGFHVAGYDGPVSTHGSPPEASVLQGQYADLSDFESPAVGVSASLVRLAFDIPCPDGMTLQSIVAIIAMALMSRYWSPAAPGAGRHVARSRPGLPPPALAPPSSWL
jgi:hypothetical protein